MFMESLCKRFGEELIKIQHTEEKLLKVCFHTDNFKFYFKNILNIYLLNISPNVHKG